jgi:predicted regulator of Ras-like GTPase activity (Roadblock/LC7/MglB family)
MSFESILGKIVNECGGGYCVALMERDGIPIVQVATRGNAANPIGDDLSAAGAEFGRILGDINKASDALGGGALSEVVINLARFRLIFEEVDEGVILVLALSPDGNLGKSRYLMRRCLPEIREEL